MHDQQSREKPALPALQGARAFAVAHACTYFSSLNFSAYWWLVYSFQCKLWRFTL